MPPSGSPRSSLREAVFRGVRLGSSVNVAGYTDALIVLYIEAKPLPSEVLRSRVGYVNKTFWRTRGIANLERDGLISVGNDPDQTIDLTEAGKEHARRLMQSYASDEGFEDRERFREALKEIWGD